MTPEKAINLATRLHPDNDLFPSPNDVIPTAREALELIRKERATCGFNWLTGEAAEEALQKHLEHDHEA